MLRFLLSLLLFCCVTGLAAPAQAQVVPDTSLNQVIPDTLPDRGAPLVVGNVRDTAISDTVVTKGPFQPNPKKSALYSAILPGTGQLYNRQYWKAPVIYAGMAASIYFLIYNTNQYQKYRSAYIGRINNSNAQDEFKDKYTTTQLQLLQNAYRKDLDMTMLFTGLGYVLQVADALTFAHLKNFDVSRDISLRAQPLALPNGTLGLGLVMNWK